MRESITLFLAVVLCLLLCQPIKSLSTFWATSKYAFTSVSDNPPLFPPILSIQFKFDKSVSPIISDTQLRLIREHNSSYFQVDWTAFSAKDITIQLYTAAGNFIGVLQEKNIQQTINQLDLAPDNIKLPAGIYYAYANCSAGLNTQNGYAKFVVK